MPIKLHNTLSGKKETFAPQTPGAVSMYNCGPTVYGTVHIGNLRTAVSNDIFRRVFEWNGYTVRQVMNITDVDDKTIRRSKEENLSLDALARKYETLFFDDIAALNIRRPDETPRATEHIAAIAAMIEKLLANGCAYKAEDGIYFSIGKASGYGKLARLDVGAETQERIANDEYDKENPRDFSLWKFHRPEDGPVAWDAPFGKGRPGWHIECSAMSIEALGETVDIHTGGADLIFPHHTNEIAQSECATGKPFVRYWLHGGMMNVSDEKMAKSKGNFLKLEDLKQHDILPIAFRYWLLGAHYRSQLNFTLEAVKAAETAYRRMAEHYSELPDGGEPDPSYTERFTAFASDDFDTPKVLALAWDMLKDDSLAAAVKKATLKKFDMVFGLNLDAYRKEALVVPPAVTALATKREEARKSGDWAAADSLRSEIEAFGFSVKDTKEGFVIVRLPKA